MEGLLVLGGGAAWLALSAWIALRAGRFVKLIWGNVIVFVVVWPLLFLAPVADELIGKYQFERYCKEAEDVKIFATILVGEEFYTADGKWKLADPTRPLEERNSLRERLNSIVRSDALSAVNIEVSAIIPIHYRDTKLYETKSGRLLAESRVYGTRGGWLSRAIFERAGFFVKAQCLPRLLREGHIEQSILPFNGNLKGAK